jgi:flotillin
MLQLLTVFNVVLAIVSLVALYLVVKVINLRRVVPTNEVHIIQTRKATVSYGKDSANGNVYYLWPAWLPIIGISQRVLPTTNFTIKLDLYDAYDKDRVPFLVDVMAFFRISDSNIAANRVATFEELKLQLTGIVQGAVRTILAQHDIDSIMVDRAKFGKMFSEEVSEQLTNWGVETVRNIELMNIHDGRDSKVVSNIMQKKMSHIEMDSRKTVASNRKEAEVAEIEAQREVDVQEQAASQLVGLRTAEKEREVGVANEQAQQTIREQKRMTAIKDAAVNEVTAVRAAEITRDVEVVKAEQTKQTSVIAAEGIKQQSIIKSEGIKQTTVIEAEGVKQQTVLDAEGKLEAAKRNAEGIQVEGAAKGAAETAILMAPVTAQTTLAKEIGSNQGYQSYLIEIRRVEAGQAIGIAQAGALEHADVKVISNTGTPVEGLTGVMDLFSAKGGTQIAALLEAINQSPQGKAVLTALTGTDSDKPETAKR